MVLIGAGDRSSRTIAARRRRDRHRHPRSGCSSSPPAPAGCGWSGGDEGRPAIAQALRRRRPAERCSARARLAGAVRDRPGLHRRRRSTSRSAWSPSSALGAHVARLPRRGAVLRRCSCLSYVEGASLHQERGGATVIARYAFNELWSFVAGWAILLDYLILIALCAFATTDYAGASSGASSTHGAPEFLLARGVIARRRGRQRARRRPAALRARGADRARRPRAAAADRRARAGAAVRPRACSPHPAPIGGAPTLEDLLFAFTLAHRRVQRPRRVLRPRRAGRDRRARGLRRLIAVRAAGRDESPTSASRSSPRAVLPRTGRPLGRGADARRRRRVRPGVAARAAALRRRDLGARSSSSAPATRRCSASRGSATRSRSTARSRRPSGRLHPTLRHARRGDRARHACWRSALVVPADLEFLAAHLRVRRDARVHARAPVRDPPALPRARPRPPVQDAVQRPHRRRRAAARRPCSAP